MEINKKCYIVAAGDETQLNFVPDEKDLVIAVDGGYNYLTKYAVVPGLLIGDMDSVNNIPDNLEKIILPCEKNDTDTFAAINEGIKRGYQDFILYCAAGGRLDHTFSNIQCLKYIARQKLNGRIITNDSVITVLDSGTIYFDKNNRGIISIFSLAEKSYGVTLNGLKYPLNNYTMTDLYPIGISNEFTGEEASVSVDDGTLLIIYTKKEDEY